jgi:hypothetical protein
MKIGRPRTLLILIVVIAIGFAIDRRRDITRYLNVKTILSEGLDGRLIPHRVNRIATLSSVLDKGIRSMEIDVMFRSDGPNGFFEVGHDEGDARGVRLDDFLDRMRAFEIKKLWLDVKNLDRTNLQAARLELQRLDSIYQIKQHAIVESYTTSPMLASLAESGFHSSYYLPLDKIPKLLNAGDETALAQEAQRLAAQLQEQSVPAVSYDLSFYSFVKSYLEPLLPPHIRYHTWNSVELGDWGAIDTLRASDYYRDPRIETIIYRF